MNTHIPLLVILLCLAAVNARHTDPSESSGDEQSHALKTKENGGDRHRRKRYHMSYGYDYQQPANPFYHPYRREYGNQDLLPEIYRLLDEISTYVRRPPPPPPQPIYIPYAIPYPVCNCQDTKPQGPTSDKPVIASRFPEMHDPNQNWGIVDDGSVEEEGDGSRPLSFVPIQPKRPMHKPPVPLDHGTQHARAPPVTQNPLPVSKPRIPDMCEVFSLSCCSGNASQQQRCFIDAGCADTYNDGKACDQERLLKIIDDYSKAYAPTN